MTQRHIPVNIGSNVKPLMALHAATAGLGAPARVTPPAYKLADALGVGLFKALRLGDKAYQIGVPMFMNALANTQLTTDSTRYGYHADGTPWMETTEDAHWDLYYGEK